MGRVLMANFTTTTPTPPINLTSAVASEALRKGGSFNPTLAVVVSTMIISFFVVGFASGYLRRWLWGQEAEARRSELMRRRRRLLSARGLGALSKPQCGLDPEVVAAMPLVRFKDLDGDEKYFDCPVCLAVFDGSDTLKLLPHCAHAFHSDCIDQWFRSHSTCPLCRVSMTSRPPVNANPSHSIRVPPDFDITEADAIPGPESHVANPVPTAGASSGGGNPRFDVIVHSNMGELGPLFVPAIRGGIAPARAATLTSIRRSRSVGTDLSQRDYVLDSEGTQHHRNLRAHVIALDHGVSRGAVACAWCARQSFPNFAANCTSVNATQ